MTDDNTPGREVERRATLLERLGSRYMPGTPKAEVLAILNATAFKTKDGPPTNAQVAALLVVADAYGLNPWTKEIFAFPDKQNGIVPVVGIDGWNRIANEHPQFAGEELEVPERDEWLHIDDDAKLCPPWIRVKVYRRDRDFPTDHTEYLDECYRAAFTGKGKNGSYKIAGPWQSHTKRMLEHKARIQARRIAFGFSGIYDQDEAERIVASDYDYEGEVVEVELLGEDGWAKLLEAGSEMGLSADDLLANAAALGHDGPGAEMPRDVAVRLFHAMRENPGDGPDDDEPDSAPQEADSGDDEAEEASVAAEEPAGAVEPDVSEEEEVPGMDAEEYRASHEKAAGDADRKPTNAEKAKLAIYLKELPESMWRGHMHSVYGVKSRADLTHAQVVEFTAWARNQRVA